MLDQIKLYTMGKTNNNKKRVLAVPTIKNLNSQKNQIEDKQSIISYKMEAVEIFISY